MKKYIELIEKDTEYLTQWLDNKNVATKIKAEYIYKLTHTYNNIIERLNVLEEQNKHLQHILEVASEERKELEEENQMLYDTVQDLIMGDK